jgi:hypothetical protein
MNGNPPRLTVIVVVPDEPAVTVKLLGFAESETLGAGLRAMPASAQYAILLRLAGKFVEDDPLDVEYSANASPLPELSGERVNPVPAVAVFPALFVPSIPKRKAPVGKLTMKDVENEALISVPIAVAAPAVVTPETS